VNIAKKMPRVPDVATVPPLIAAQREKHQIYKHLPSFLQNQGTRFGNERHNEVSLRGLNVQNSSFLEVKSSLNTDKMQFRVDPKTKKKVGEPLRKRRERTFDELLKSEGFVPPDPIKEEKKREWHIPKLRNLD
jgi:endonuclease III-like uncharacterized protein